MRGNNEHDMKTVNRSVVAARRAFRAADTIPDRDRVLAQGIIVDLRGLLDEIEAATR